MKGRQRRGEKAKRMKRPPPQRGHIVVYNGLGSGEPRRRESQGEFIMAWQDRIVVDPAVLVGKPIVKGTRLAVEFIIELLAQGWSEADIFENYPGLTGEDIRGCLAYAGERLRAEKVYPLGV
jgi:uncharacterized protein (DUF433 family)